MISNAQTLELITTINTAIRYLRAYFTENGKYNLSMVADINSAVESVAESLSLDAPPVLNVQMFEENSSGANDALNLMSGWLLNIEHEQRGIRKRIPAIQREILDAVEGKGDIMSFFHFEPTDRVEARPDIVLDLVRGKNVLHLGCTDHIALIDERIREGVFFHHKLMDASAKCLGVDINQEAVEHLKKLGFDNILCRDITEPGIEEITREHWDYIVIGEVLEHVDNPVAFLKAIAENYRRNIQRFIITAPNALCLKSVFNSYQHGTEGINSDHKYWFTPYTLCNVVYRAGLKAENMRMCAYGLIDDFIKSNYSLLREKPLLLETIVLEGTF